MDVPSRTTVSSKPTKFIYKMNFAVLSFKIVFQDPSNRATIFSSDSTGCYESSVTQYLFILK